MSDLYPSEHTHTHMCTLVCTGDIKENLEDELVQKALKSNIVTMQHTHN